MNSEEKELAGLVAVMIIGLIACLCIASAIIENVT